MTKFYVFLIQLVLFLIICCEHVYVNAVICYSCDSTKIPECATNPKINELTWETCSSLLHKCVVSIVDQITYRGCSNKVPLASPNSLYYRSCDTNLCNNMIFPPGRLKCHQCDGKYCVGKLNSDTNTLKACKNFLENDTCYTDIIDESHAIRGCLSDNYVPNKYTQFCEHNGCNHQDGIKNLTCLKCDNMKTDCVRVIPPTNPLLNCTIPEKTGSCTLQYLLGRPEETCHIYHRYNKFNRGCRRFLEHVPTDKEHLSTCKGDFCNTLCANYTKCIVCDSKTESKCKDKPEELNDRLCTIEDTSCFATLHESSGDVIRGCGTPKKFINSYHCQTDKCNAKPFRKCFKCSSKSDENCAQWKEPEKIDQVICESPDDMCITAIRGDRTTERGCKIFNQLDCSSSSLIECTNCTGNLCNSGIFPEKRLKCHHCQGTEECSKEQLDIKNSLPCLKYNKNDKCFEYANNKNLMYRGCESDESIFLTTCIQQNEKCLRCIQSGCNSHKATYKPKLSCYSCNDTKEKFGPCAWSQTLDSLVKCNASVMFYAKEKCFNRKKSEGLYSRGCSIDEKMCTKDKAEVDCETCDTSECNSNNLIQQMCVQCRSNNIGELSCSNNAEGIPSKNCTNDEQYHKKRGCFTKVEVNKVVTRGCTFDMMDNEFLDCIQIDNKNCIYCKEQNCNIITAPQYSKSTNIESLKLLFLLFIINLLLVIVF